MENVAQPAAKIEEVQLSFHPRRAYPDRDSSLWGLGEGQPKTMTSIPYLQIPLQTGTVPVTIQHT